eukprot:6213202-Pleurochrysis_carterae.AAC.1
MGGRWNPAGAVVRASVWLPDCAVKCRANVRARAYARVRVYVCLAPSPSSICSQSPSPFCFPSLFAHIWLAWTVISVTVATAFALGASLRREFRFCYKTECSRLLTSRGGATWMLV